MFTLAITSNKSSKAMIITMKKNMYVYNMYMFTLAITSNKSSKAMIITMKKNF